MVPELPAYQFPALRSSGCSTGPHIPLAALACGGRGRERKQKQVQSLWPQDLCRGGNAEAEERLHHRAVTRQAQSTRKGCHPCGAGEQDSAENLHNSPDTTCSCCSCRSPVFINSALIYPAKDRHLKMGSKGCRVLCSLFMTESLSSCIKKLQSSAGTQGDFLCDIKMKSLSVHHFWKNRGFA